MSAAPTVMAPVGRLCASTRGGGGVPNLIKPFMAEFFTYRKCVPAMPGARSCDLFNCEGVSATRHRQESGPA